MARLVPIAGFAAMIAARASAASPSFKSAPAADKGQGGGSPFSLNFDPGLEGKQAEYFEMARDLLTNYYGYLGVVFVLLCLYLFGRGSKGKAEKGKDRRAPREEVDDYYEIDDLDDLVGKDARPR